MFQEADHSKFNVQDREMPIGTDGGHSAAGSSCRGSRCGKGVPDTAGSHPNMKYMHLQRDAAYDKERLPRFLCLRGFVGSNLVSSENGGTTNAETIRFSVSPGLRMLHT